METHSIRLRGPWLLTPLAQPWELSASQGNERAGGLSAPVIQRLPADWRDVLGAGFLGTVAYERSFGLPSNLAPGDQVRLVYDFAPGQSAEVLRLRCWLNGDLLADEQRGTGYVWQVAGKLISRNHLRLEVTQTPVPKDAQAIEEARGLTGVVRLEICPAGA
ncbi:MAG: hypothetical protein SFX18_17165 [Pirellulales bacterium]|nr:hypothetical protein [Pirellulales bacterium]